MKKAGGKRFNWKTILIAFVALAVLGVIFGGGDSKEKDKKEDQAKIEESKESDETASKEENEEDASATESQDNDSESDGLSALKKELDEKYGVTEPTSFVRGDNTGKWRKVVVYNGTPTEDYAVDYAKAYMNDGDIHYIINLGLKTTTMLRTSSLGILDTKTTEYVDKEEHDASIIGEGLLLSEKSFNMETGEEFSSESDANAGTVSDEELIAKVKEVIAGQVGEGEVITDVAFDGSNLTVYVDMSGADTKMFSARDISLSRISSITDQILDLDDSYTNTWETITVDFGEVGKAELNKGMIKNGGLGKYFEFSDDILK